MRTQVGGFLAGFAIAGGIAMYQLQKEVWSSHRLLLQQVRGNASSSGAAYSAFDGLLTSAWMQIGSMQIGSGSECPLP
jgi:hypothetical protein